MNESVQLDAVGDWTISFGGARTRGIDSVQSERDVAGLVSTKLCEVGPGELAVEQSVEFRVLWRGLAVGHLQAVGSIARLLNEQLGQPDHLGVAAKLFGEVDHLVGRVLLVAVSSGSQETRKGCLGKGVALTRTTRGEACLFPVMCGICDGLSDALLERKC